MTALKGLLLVVFVASLAGVAVVVLGDHEPPRPAVVRSRPTTPRVAAVRSATRFLVGLDAATLLDPESRRRFVARWSSRHAEDELQHLYEAEAARMAPLEGGYSRAAMLGYRVDRLGTDSAEVTIWAVSLASVGDLPAAVGWRTLTVSLVPEDGRWKITQVREVPGPSLDSPPAELRKRAARFVEYRLAP